MLSSSFSSLNSTSVGSALQSGAQALLKAGVELNSLAAGVQADLSPAATIQVQADQAQLDSSGQALSNTQDAINTLKTAQAGLGAIADRVQDIQTVAVAAANGIGGPDVQAAYQQQVQSDLQAIQNIASNTQFNGQNLLDGSAGTLTFQTGPSPGQTASISIPGALPSQLGTGVTAGQSLATVDVSTPQGASQAIQIAAAAGQQVASASGQLGAFQSGTLEPAANSLTQSISALSDTTSRFRDTNYVTTMMALVQAQISARSSVAVIAQADQLQQSTLSLLGPQP